MSAPALARSEFRFFVSRETSSHERRIHRSIQRPSGSVGPPGDQRPTRTGKYPTARPWAKRRIPGLCKSRTKQLQPWGLEVVLRSSNTRQTLTAPPAPSRPTRLPLDLQDPSTHPTFRGSWKGRAFGEPWGDPRGHSQPYGAPAVGAPRSIRGLAQTTRFHFHPRERTRRQKPRTRCRVWSFQALAPGPIRTHPVAGVSLTSAPVERSVPIPEPTPPDHCRLP